MNDFKLIFQFLAPYKLKVSLSLFCHILMAIFTIISIPLIIPLFHFLFSTAPKTASRPTGLLDALGWLEYYFVKLIDTQGPSKALIYTCLVLMLTFFFKNLFRYLAMYFMIPVRSSVVNGLRTGLYDSYLQMGYNTRNEHKRGDLLTRMTVDVQEVEYSILRFIEAIFKSPILILGSVLLMLSIHKGLTLFVFVLMLFTLLVIGTLSKTLKKSSTRLQSTLATLTGHVDESLDGLQMLNIFRVTDTWRQKFDKTNRLHKDIYDKVTRRQELSSPLSEFLGVAVVICLLWYGAQLVFAKELKPAVFFAFVFAFYHVIEPLKSFSTAFYNIRKGSASLERISSITALSVPQEDSGKPFHFNHRIEFEKVGFSYGTEPILNQVSFVINQGEKMALVGNSGSGKSTIISLLLKIILPQEGRILIDGVDLSEISKKALYEKLGLVSQSPFLYNASLRDNLTLGRGGISDEVIWEALGTASAKAFVSGLEAGLDTEVGDRGELLSGGERQRITIARALLEDPTLLIFDEPTSALDPAAERKVSSAIINAMQERTALIVAHRLSTIQQADRIMFLEKGKVIEQGTHQELIAQEGRYNEYVNMQTLGLL